MELEAANKPDMSVHGMCNLELSVHGLIIDMDALVVDLNCHAILGMDILGDASKLPFILDLVGGTLSGGGYETIQLHRFQAATECFAETTDSVCIPPHSEVMLWAKLKTNNGRSWTHSWGCTCPTDFCSGVWPSRRQIVSARRR